MSVGHVAKDSERRLLAVNKRLKEGTYEPQPVKRVMIPKAGSAELRPLGIASLRSPLRGYSFVVGCLAALGSDGGGPRGADRRKSRAKRDRQPKVERSESMAIEPIFEREFHPQSYGFRPGRGCKDALRRVDELLKSGLNYVVEVDIKG